MKDELEQQKGNKFQRVPVSVSSQIKGISKSTYPGGMLSRYMGQISHSRGTACPGTKDMPLLSERYSA